MPTRGSKARKDTWLLYVTLIGAVFGAIALLVLEDVKHWLVRPTPVSAAAPPPTRPLVVLSPKEPEELHDVLIEVYEAQTMVHVGKDSYVVESVPVVETNVVGGRHFASLTGSLICITDNLDRGWIEIYRDKRRNGEYMAVISRRGHDPIERICTPNH